MGCCNGKREIFFNAIGQDSHRFEHESFSKPLILGGVVIPGLPGLSGNSDADVILHALCNAISGLSTTNILGAVTDRLCNEQGIVDSRVYVEKALETLGTIRLLHVSITVEAQRPRLTPNIDAIRRSVAEILSLPFERVGLTATSGAGLTSFGTGDGIQGFIIASASRSV